MSEENEKPSYRYAVICIVLTVLMLIELWRRGALGRALGF